MPRIVLKDLETDKTITVQDAEASIGRDPASSIVVEGPSSKVVSGNHARLFFQDNAWWVEDTSRNGTLLDDERLRRGERHAVRVGQILGLGESGPRYRLLSLEGRRVAETMVESAPPAPQPPAAPPAGTAPLKQAGAAPPRAPAPAPSAAEASPSDVSTTAMRRSDAIRAGLKMPEETTEPMAPAPDWIVHVGLRETHTNQHWDVRGEPVRLGRSPECLVQIPPEQGASVSRVHAEFTVKDGGICIRDLGSRNGTYLNGKRLSDAAEVRRSDLIMLGAGGPTFSVEDLHIVKGEQSAPRPVPADAGPVTPARGGRVTGGGAGGEPPTGDTPRKPGKVGGSVKKAMGPATNLARRSFAGVGRTAFFKDVLEDMSQKSAKRVRVIVWTSVGATILIAAILLWATQQRVAASEARMAQERAAFEARADSIRLAASAEADRLRAAFDSARESSAPRAVLDSLREALADASRRTGVLEVALQRARQSLDQQLASGDSARRRAEEEMIRLRAEMARAQAADGSRATFDSLRRALRMAEERAGEIAAQLKTVRNSNADLALVAQLNQNAVGLVSMFVDTSAAEGTGFAITPSGYFVTNRHVVMTDSGRVADSVFVTMADRRYGNWHRADVVEVGRGDLDVAILRLRGYRGPYIKKVDWSGMNAKQGDPAALIGFPRGTMLAFDNDTVRTSMSAGIFSKITPSRIQFDGFSQGGSSGSPVFTAAGEVVAVHFAGLRGAVGLGFAVPVARIVPLLPADARSELGLP